MSPAGNKIRSARMAHTPYCHRGDNLSKKSRLAMSSTTAVSDAAKV